MDKRKEATTEEFTKKSFVESQKTIREQKLLLQKLRKENLALREELQEETALSIRSTKSQGSSQTLNKLSNQIEVFITRIELEKRHLGDVDVRLKQVNDRILERKSGTAERSTLSVKKQLANSEEKLHAWKTKFASMIADNKGLRDRIDEYRRDHVLFRLQCGRFEEQLAATAHDIERVIRDSKHIFEEREDIAARIQELRDLADEEQKAYMAQCRELNGVLQAFDEIEAKPSAIGVQLDFADVFGNMTEEQEEELQKKIVKGKWQVAKEKALAEVLRGKAEGFEEAFSKIQSATGFERIDDFVAHFIQIEEHNFHRFQYLNSLNVDIDKLETEVAELRREEDVLRQETSTSDRNFQTVKAVSEERIEKIEAISRDLEEKASASSKLLEKVSKQVNALSAAMGCSAERAGDNQSLDEEVTDANIVDYLGGIEAKVNELLVRYAALAKSGRNFGFDDGRNFKMIVGPSDAKKSAKPLLDSGRTSRLLRFRPPSIASDDDSFYDGVADGDEMPIDERTLRSKVDASAQALLTQLDTADATDSARRRSAHGRQRPHPPISQSSHGAPPASLRRNLTISRLNVAGVPLSRSLEGTPASERGEKRTWSGVASPGLNLAARRQTLKVMEVPIAKLGAARTSRAGGKLVGI